MKEKAILFSTPMVKAILAGEKTQTRRVVKPQPELNNGFWELGGAGWGDNIKKITPIYGHSLYNRMPYKPGDILWVRETWSDFYKNGYIYRADEERVSVRWKPSIFMPRDAARLFLEVKTVRFERLWNISEEDADAEGFTEISDFQYLWDSLNAKRGYSWESNPWVWVYEFERMEKWGK